MAALAGEILTAARVNRLQPTPYVATATADLAGPQTSGALTGASITLTTLTANAKCHVNGFFDFDHSGSTTTFATGELFLDGVKQTTEAVYQQGISTDRLTPGNTWLITVGTAGSHTFDLRVTLPTSISAHQVNSRLVVVIYEVV